MWISARFYMCLISVSVLDFLFLFKQKTADEMRISDWSSDVCSSDLSRRRYDCKRLQLGGVESGLAAKPINHILGLCIILPTVVPTNANPKINGRPTTVAIRMRPPSL